MFRKAKLFLFIFIILTLSCVSYLPLNKVPSEEETSGTENEKPAKPSESPAEAAVESAAAGPEKSNNQTVVFLPEDSYTFWNKIVTSEMIQKYKAVNGRTKCNLFLSDILLTYFGEDVYNSIFPEGMKRPNVLYADWKTNENLIRLTVSDYTIDDIQQLANNNYLIIMAYRYDQGPGHVAFVGHEKLKLRTIPPINNLEGKNGTELKSSWLPVMVQSVTTL